MSTLILEHIKINELPYSWVKQLPPARTVTVTIAVENIPPQSPIDVPENQETFKQYMRSQGINIGRLEESIKQLETGEVETVELDKRDDLLDNSISSKRPLLSTSARIM